MNLQTPLVALPGVGPVFKTRLDNLGIKTVEDLIFHFPFRYDDYSNNTNVSDLKVSEIVTLKGEVWSIKNEYTRSHKTITKAIFNDGTGPVDLIWFNQSWLPKSIKVGDTIQISGKVTKNGAKISIVAPRWDKALRDEESQLNTGRLVPIYPETGGITSKWLRLKISQLLGDGLRSLEDPLPEHIKNDMLSLQEALTLIHFPKDFKDIQKARDRLSFDEVFYIQLASQKKRLEWRSRQSVASFKVDKQKEDDFIKKLPFSLTSAQKRVIDEITSDLQSGYAMNRLVQGEVGSGKTVVAAAMIYLTFTNNFNSVLMAPTEILAFQHHQTLTKLLSPLGLEVGLYTGSRKEVSDKSQVIVGTHALLSEKLVTKNIGLVIIDEQQRFGVAQRSFLRSRAKVPHFLTMTATPIPRTVALTLYGDLDLSVIDELPSNRKPIKTYFVPQKKRQDAYKFIEGEVKKGFQVYIITPLIEESETLISVKAAKAEFDSLKKDVFPNLNLGLLHGRLKAKEKEQIIRDFKDRKIDILISTSVVEVGVDIPNATIMVIEGAERFGLAQLHQLRGRVGRGSEQSYTFLFTQDENPIIVQRLRNLERINNGLALSELDLKIRGSGEIFGTKQSGDWDLKIADLTDLSLIENAQKTALKILQDSPRLDKYPLLASKLSRLAQEIMPD